MTHRLATNDAKNYCNRTLVKVIVENVVTCFLGTRCTYIHKNFIKMMTTHQVDNNRNTIKSM